ncbi:hypothetical protein EMIHUDRAFT_121783 [Emiliania huxleyi CCMP1516]|uniref:Uncharacterized protein n=2 Tax=Emiliania huxleyi TaxID=2903 RepID=A0A0D3HXA0_EMIH1|nr:hypothetical protein EMIHUDRAFT_121783 [Emiliania huxleyi CCMP1516]EOD03635.1 hypothetical protein EMIHUDRAFT_121783 [Emiliania huxleyi CCMP1516]|eukprot:XP_005756064.1 hypothetical protein EMIHUDRAFT_121783 [Emiliania huxleyi CCMP1516]
MQDARLLQRVGHAANRAEDYPHARAAFLFVAKLTGRSEARASAANMALREAARCGSEWLANVAYEELDRVLSLPNLAPSIASVCQAKRQEAEQLRDRLAEEAAERGEASVAGCADEPDGARKRKRSGAIARPPCDEAALQPPRCEAPLSETPVLVNRSPALTLWAAFVAQRLGHDWQASLSLATALAAMFARAKGRSLGLPQPATNKFDAATQSVDLLGEAVPALYTSRGLRGLTLSRLATGDDSDSAPEPASPLQAQRSLSAAFGARFGEAYIKLAHLAAALPRRALVAHGNRRAYEMYCLFRPHIPEGRAGWGQAGRLLLSGQEPSSLEALHDQALLEECREVERQEALAAALAAAGEQGIRIDALATLAGGETQRAREWIEEQQLAGAAYEQGGSYFPL